MLDIAIDVARQAGAVLRERFDQPRQVDYKGPFDLVTDADRASEQLIVSMLAKHVPDHTVIAEEGGGSQQDSPWTWLIDPLDGTNNYAHGFPFFCVSIALLRDNIPFLGVIYDPNRDELFAAQQGNGATCNNRPIYVSRAPTLSVSLLSTGFPYEYATNPANNAAEFTRMHNYVQGIRRAGSAALDLAYVASGRLEAHWELRLKPWDSAAGALLVLEAGGRLSDWRGGEWTPWSGDLIASNGFIHDEMIQVLNG
jgi:myo-inositol-1(or 4)-monophosphatase